MADKDSTNIDMNVKSCANSNITVKRQNSTNTSRSTLPTYDSLSTDKPPSYISNQYAQRQTSPKPTAGASAATIRAVMGDPVPKEPRRSLRDRLLGRRPNYNRRPPSSERRSQGSSAQWNVWGSPVSDPSK